ncbi:MAG TPA: DUF3040 domain-containing protein [Streptosporangiaceae bacterium]|nr:DUF3040 domain-containing protein [Streptosporangiaceae bacterium]
MDEQRILEEMERVLAADDPRLAAQLASFGRPGLGHAIRTRRVRSLLTLAMLATVAVLIYAMIAFRLGGVPHGPRPPHHATRTASVVSDRDWPPPQPVRAPHATIRG